MKPLVNDANYAPELARLVAAARGFRRAAHAIAPVAVAALPELAELDNALGHLHAQRKGTLTSLWKQDHCLAASAEGWDVVENAGALRVIRTDATTFASDDAAALHVYGRALAGSDLHLLAIRLTLGSA